MPWPRLKVPSFRSNSRRWLGTDSAHELEGFSPAKVHSRAQEPPLGDGSGHHRLHSSSAELAQPSEQSTQQSHGHILRCRLRTHASCAFQCVIAGGAKMPVGVLQLACSAFANPGVHQVSLRACLHARHGPAAAAGETPGGANERSLFVPSSAALPTACCRPADGHMLWGHVMQHYSPWRIASRPFARHVHGQHVVASSALFGSRLSRLQLSTLAKKHRWMRWMRCWALGLVSEAGCHALAAARLVRPLFGTIVSFLLTAGQIARRLPWTSCPRMSSCHRIVLSHCGPALWTLVIAITDRVCCTGRTAVTVPRRPRWCTDPAQRRP